jgi:tetratricopeptide (TPR) repeat protein
MRAWLLCLLWSGMAAAGDSAAEEARRHFNRGRELYGAQQYREAIEEFERARQAKPLPAFDYNLGRCHEELGEIDEAIAAYESYLSSTVAEDSEEVRRHVSELREQRRPRVRKKSPVLAPAIVAGVGGAVLVTGVALLGSAASDYSAADSSCSPRCNPSLGSDLEKRYDAGLALVAVAGALAVADAVLWGLRARKPVLRAAINF